MGSLVRKGGVCIAGQVLQGYTGADNRRRYRSARCEICSLRSGAGNRGWITGAGTGGNMHSTDLLSLPVLNLLLLRTCHLHPTRSSLSPFTPFTAAGGGITRNTPARHGPSPSLRGGERRRRRGRGGRGAQEADGRERERSRPPNSLLGASSPAAAHTPKRATSTA